MNGCSIISLTYNFDYEQFDKPELQNIAKKTLGEFFSFVRSTFDSLIETGQILQDLYYDCLDFCPKGKKVFEDWLASNDFGASRYIAKSAMEIYLWYSKLSPKVQRLVSENVQNWSVSALRQLTKVSNDLVKELVGSGKKTALEVRKEGGRGSGGKNGEAKSSDSHTSEETSCSSPLLHSPTPPPPLPQPEFAPGMRIIVTGDDYGCNGHRGIILSQDKDSWWVLLDHVVAQGSMTKNLFKPNQIEIEGIVENPDTKDVFTAVQVEQKIKEVLAQRDKQALSAQPTVREEELEKIQLQKEELMKKLQAQECELERISALATRNQQLEQRATELEQSLENINQRLRQIQSEHQAEKVANSDLRESIASLQVKVQQLSSALLIREQEVAQLQAINTKQQKEIQRLSVAEISKQETNDREEKIVGRLGELGQRSGWKGWSGDGYEAADGTLYRGINAIAAFINDLTQRPSYQSQS